MTQELDRPKVGVGVLIFRGNKILLGYRSHPKKHGFATWAPPGGHLEFKESFEQCATREVLEETGLHVTNVRFTTVTNDIFINNSKHYITIWMIADCSHDQAAKNLEPDRCSELKWFEWDQLPKELFVPFANLLKQGFVPSFYKGKAVNTLPHKLD